jgi:hypothetical protein
MVASKRAGWERLGHEREEAAHRLLRNVDDQDDQESGV